MKRMRISLSSLIFFWQTNFLDTEILIWHEKRMQISLSSLIFGRKMFRYSYIDIAWKDAAFPYPPWFLKKKLFARYCWYRYTMKKMQISLPCLIFLLKKLSYLLYWYSMKGCGSPYPPWFFGKDWVASYVDIAWKDADFPTLLEFLRPFLLDTHYIDIAWNKDKEFPTLLEF